MGLTYNTTLFIHNNAYMLLQVFLKLLLVEIKRQEKLEIRNKMHIKHTNISENNVHSSIGSLAS